MRVLFWVLGAKFEGGRKSREHENITDTCNVRMEGRDAAGGGQAGDPGFLASNDDGKIMRRKAYEGNTEWVFPRPTA